MTPRPEHILPRLAPFRNNRRLVVKNQGVSDIISGIQHTHGRHASEYDRICPAFAARDPRDVGRKIWDFLKKNTHYVIEPDDAQTLRSPSAILTLGGNPRVGVDCKSYSLFAAGILDALNRRGYQIPWAYRFASYRIFDKMPHHVFVVINPGANEIWIDPVLPAFDYKKPYQYKTDKNMSLYTIAGIGGRKQKRQEKKAQRQQKRQIKRQATKQKIKATLKKRGRIFVKFNPATASARNSFLLLVKLNVFNLGKRLAALVARDPSGLKKFWEKLGGNWASLQKNIAQGAARKHGKAVGALPAVAAAIAAATPIVVKVIDLLKKAGIGTEDLAAAAKKVVQKVVARKIENAPEGEPIQPEESDFEGAAEGVDVPEESEISEEMQEESESESEDGEGMAGPGVNAIIPLAGIALGVYFLTKK